MIFVDLVLNFEIDGGKILAHGHHVASVKHYAPSFKLISLTRPLEAQAP